MAKQDKYQFQCWALGLVGARPVEQQRGADHGIDGKILFRDNPKASKAEQIIIRVNGGKTRVKDVRDLRGVLEREKAAMGILVSLQPTTRDRMAEAASAGFYEHKTIRLIGLHPLMSGGDCQGQGYLKQGLAGCKPIAWEVIATLKPGTSHAQARNLGGSFVFSSYSARILFVFSGGALGGATAAPPRPWLALTVLVGRSFKGNSTFLCLSSPWHSGGSPRGV